VPDRRISRRQALGQGPRLPRQTGYRAASGPRPDRVAGWAVALGIFLVLVAGATSRANTGGSHIEPSGEEQRTLGERPDGLRAREVSLDLTPASGRSVRLSRTRRAHLADVPLPN
jgi:hypothetical protein